jgi:hypothetical protein
MIVHHFYKDISQQISTSTVQRRLCESGLHDQIAAKKPLLKDKKKKLAWAKKHEQWTLERWKCVLASPNLRFWVLTSVSLRCRVGEQMISTCVVPNVKHGGGGLWCSGALLVILSVIYLEFKAYTLICLALFGYYMIPYVLFHSVDVFTVIPQKKNP